MDTNVFQNTKLDSLRPYIKLQEYGYSQIFCNIYKVTYYAKSKPCSFPKHTKYGYKCNNVQTNSLLHNNNLKNIRSIGVKVFYYV